MNEPAATDSLDTVPQIDLRIPGPWKSPEELVESLRKAKTGYGVTAEGEFFHEKSGRKFLFSASAPDDEIASLFAHTGRLSDGEVKALAAHKVKVHVSGPGGSAEAAKAVMKAATALIKAGGLGVFVDNSGNAHGVDDWLALAGDTQSGGLYWAYVSATGDRQTVWSMGMHCLGFRDAEVVGVPDRNAAGFLLHNFLGYASQSGIPICDGDPVGGESGPLFRAHARPCTRFKPGTPFHNPYGVWRLEPIEGDGPDALDD
jgi:hypothetical protein